MSFNKDGIPDELKSLRQWVCSGRDKKPVTPGTGAPASPTDPLTWGTYSEAVNSGQINIGFVLSPHDPYCIVDLDDKEDNPATPEQLERFMKIINSLDSYTEISQGGRGVHIVCKGSVPRGAKKDHVEVYSESRYMIFTGNVLRDREIKDCQETLNHLYSEMQSSRTFMELDWIPPIVDDNEIYRMGSSADNAEKFNNLWNGNWQVYPEYAHEGQSSADLALFSMLCFYSSSNEQVIRMFRASALGQRDKAGRDDYMIRCVQRARSTMQTPKIDFTNLQIPYFPEPEPEPEKIQPVTSSFKDFHMSSPCR